MFRDLYSIWDCCKKQKKSMRGEIELVVLKTWSSQFVKDPDFIAILKRRVEKHF